MFKLILFGIVFFVLYRAVTKKRMIVRPDTSPDVRNAAGQIAGEMVQDPLCKAYFPREQGVALDHQDEVLLFCSRDCLEKYKVIIDATSNDSIDGRL